MNACSDLCLFGEMSSTSCQYSQKSIINVSIVTINSNNKSHIF